MADFNQAGIQAVIDGMHSRAAASGAAERYLDYEPKSPPGQGLTLAFWLDSITAVPALSGLATVSLRITFAGRFYKSFLAKDESKIDPDIAGGVLTLMAVLSEAFTLGGAAMEVDLLAQAGQPIGAQFAYTTLGDKHFRIADVAIPVLYADAWKEVA